MTGVGKEDCNALVDVENDLVTRIINMDFNEFLNGEASREGSDEETTPTLVGRKMSMVKIWLEQAKQEDEKVEPEQEDDPLCLEELRREQAEQLEDPLGLEGLRRIKPDGPLDEELEASTLSLSQLHLQQSSSFQPSSIDRTLTNQTQQHNQGLVSSHNQSFVSSNNRGVAPSHNDIDFVPYVHPYSAVPRQARSRSPTDRPTNPRSNVHRPTTSGSSAHPRTNSRFSDGCTFNPDNHPSCQERRSRSQENNGRSSLYNMDLSLREVNPETNYNWSTNSNSDTVPPYQARSITGSVSSFQTSNGSASGFQNATSSASGFQNTTGSAFQNTNSSPWSFQNTTSSAWSFQNTNSSVWSFQNTTNSAWSFQNTTGSSSRYQSSTSLGASRSGLTNGLQPFSTVGDDDRSRSQSLGGGMRPTLVGQPGGPRRSGRRGGNGRRFCNFCKTNGESSDVYLSHSTGAPGAVTCPNLFKHSCEICAATGSNAHTRGYCPQRRSNSPPVVLELKGTQRKSDGSLR